MHICVAKIMKLLLIIIVIMSEVISSTNKTDLNRNRLTVPLFSPLTIAQAFESSHYSQIRNVTVRWASVPDCSQLNNFFYYICLVNLTSQEEIYIKTTKLASVTFYNIDSDSYEFRIYSRNNFGLSETYSTVSLPSSEALLSGPRMINVFVSAKSYQIEWEAPNNISGFTNFTVFWCQVKYYIDDCIGTLHWQYITENHFTLNHSVDYKFAVSLNTNESTSGITWAKCIVQLPINELYHVTALTQSPTAVLVKWQFYCEAQSRVVQSYTFEYCPVANCHRMQSESIKNIFNADQYVIDNLQPNTKYKIIFSSLEFKEKYEIYGTTDLGIPSRPKHLKVYFSKKTNIQVFWWRYSRLYFKYFKIQIIEKSLSKAIDIEVNQTQANCQQNICRFSFAAKLHIKPFTKYNFQVSACNSKGICSYPPTSAAFRTLPGKPGKMLNPPVEKLTESSYRIYFQKPVISNGPITHFIVHEEDLQNNHVEKYTFPGNLSHADIEILCQNASQFETFKISIAASNFIIEKSQEITGNFSESTAIDLCFRSFTLKSANTDSKTVLSTFAIISITVSVAFVISATYFVIRYFKNLQLQKKQFKINVECNDEAVDVNKNKNDDDINRHFMQMMSLNSGVLSSRYYNVNFDIVLNTLYVHSFNEVTNVLAENEIVQPNSDAENEQSPEDTEHNDTFKHVAN